MPQLRSLIEGIDVSPWPSMKLNRANELLATLFGQVGVWNASRSFMAPVQVSVDRQYVELLAPRGSRPPADEWALALGDAVHNARSALDGLVWDLAHLDGGTPKRPRSLAFPIVSDERKWREAVDRNLSGVSDIFVERIKAVQPFLHPQEDGVASWLHVLSELDNADKHRGLIVAVPIINALSIEGMSLQLDMASAEQQGSFRVENRFDELPDGEPLARLSFGRSIAKNSVVPAVAHVEFQPSVRYRDSLFAPELIRTDALAHVNGVLSFLRTGVQPEDEAREEVKLSPKPSAG
ncbi:hypothetical protein [Frigoribacterium endophyticum]|uniref:hypothetical protein n=1 Tax=Frigoribacterium endophyticum TaxID=1522176 RepID=UPI0014200C5F|nr:hypothetical protein [Frigoribacterium endophyticum]NII52112.1 hypothetical protein [Frigoribacterium endophyticum]